MGKKKIIIAVVVILVIGAGAVLYSFADWGAVTDRGKFENCMETCYELLLQESSKQYCPEQCTNDTGYSPSDSELASLIAELKSEETASNAGRTNANSATAAPINKNTNSSSIANTDASPNANLDLSQYQGRSYYCNWVWPQEIIDKDSGELIVECDSVRPYCHYDDYSFEKIGCCTSPEYTDCITLPNLLQTL